MQAQSVLGTPAARNLVSSWLISWRSFRWSTLQAGVAYLFFLFLHQFPPQHSLSPFFNYLADAFLHGQLSLRFIPSNLMDLVVYKGNVYLYWPPFPAIVSLPFVALFGVDFNDMFLTVALGVLNVGLVALLIRRADEKLHIGLSPLQQGLLVLFFALGTVHTPLVARGRVWETAQLIGFACVALTYLCVLSRRGASAFVFAGLAVGAAAATRNHLIFTGLWPAWYLIWTHRQAGWRRLSLYCLMGLLPVVATLLLLGSYNFARFGSPLDAGLDYHTMDNAFKADYALYGPFHIHYLPTNLYYQLVNYPFLRDPLVGGSLFLMSPVWFAVFWAMRWVGTRLHAAFLGVSVLLTDIPILLLMGTGWWQWGSRYTLDFTVPLLLLAMLGVRHWPASVQRVLTSVSLVHFIVGAVVLAYKLH